MSENITPTPEAAPTPPQKPRSRSLFWPILLIGVGVMLLLNNLGIVSWNTWNLIWRFWPLVLVAIGIDVLFGQRSVLGAVFSAMLVLALMAVIALGPRPRLGDPPPPPSLPEDLEAYLRHSEEAVPDLRSGEHKEIVWANGARERTPFSVVYLHGFSADRHEIDPVPRRVAESLGANLYHARLTGHGQDGAALAGGPGGPPGG